MADTSIGLLIGMLAVAIPLIAVAKRFDIAYPIVLVLGGLVLGFVPGLPTVQLDPSLVLLIFLPPLLYWESITAPSDVMLKNAGQIGVLVVGLVVATTVAVAAVAHAIVPGLSWGAAFVLGAIVSPTDELAAVPVLEHFRLPRRVIAIVEGESLLNDATALVLYASALAVVAAGTFQPGAALLHFALTVVGSIAIGLLAGWLGVRLWQSIRDPQLQSIVSVLLSFVAFYPAQRFSMSGVLAVVTAGIYANWYTPRVVTPVARTQITGFWNTLVFLANALLFLVLGLQLHGLAVRALANDPWPMVVWYVVAVNAVVVIVRLALVELAEYLPTAAPPEYAEPNWKNALVVGWSGLRGAVSLAAALAIPLALPGGAPFPHRDLIIFLTFSVIGVTLIGGGLSLPAVVAALRIEPGNEERDEMRSALIRSFEAALERIDELEAGGRVDADHAASLRRKFQHRIDVEHVRDTDDGAEHAARDDDVNAQLVAAQREAIIGMREAGEIDNVVLRRLQIDLDATLIAGHPAAPASAAADAQDAGGPGST